MTVRIRNSSRLIHSNLFTTGGVEYWELPEYPEIDVRSDDLSHEIAEGDRIDKIANSYYGDPNLWWIVALANGLRIIPADMVVGNVLRIPSPVYVSGVLLSVKDK